MPILYSLDHIHLNNISDLEFLEAFEIVRFSDISEINHNRSVLLSSRFASKNVKYFASIFVTIQAINKH